MNAKTIVEAVRNRLGDSRKERWTDDTLLLYVSLCQNDVAVFTHFFREQYIIQLLENQYVYSLPSNCLAVTRLEYADNFLPVETRNEIDKGTATYPCVLFDNLAFQEVEFVTATGGEDLLTALRSLYGVTSFSEGLADDFGVVTDIEEEDDTQPLDEVLVYFAAMPPLLEMVDSTPTDSTEEIVKVLPTDALLLPDVWLQAFIHFVTGMALQDDNDANNLTRGEMEAQKYNRLLGQIKKTSSKDFTTNIRSKLTTTVRGI